MTTIYITLALMVAGALSIASPHYAVRVIGVACMATGCMLWLGMDVLCGTGPLMDCAVLQ